MYGSYVHTAVVHWSTSFIRDISVRKLSQFYIDSNFREDHLIVLPFSAEVECTVLYFSVLELFLSINNVKQNTAILKATDEK